MSDRASCDYRSGDESTENSYDGSLTEAVSQNFVDELEEGSQGDGHKLGGKLSSERSSESRSEQVEGRRVIAKFLERFTCYDLVPKSSKVVIFDRNIPARLSYYALVEHEIGAAPLWDPLSQTLSGIVTTLDLIEMLRFGHSTNCLLEILDNHSVSSWRSLVSQLLESPEIEDSLIEAGMPAVQAASMAAKAESLSTSKNSIFTNAKRANLSVHPECSLYDACMEMRRYSVHWVPVLDVKAQSCLGVVTHLSILQYLVSNFVEDRRLFDQPIHTLGIGTLENIITATLDTKVVTILDLMCLNHISCVPIVDSLNRPIAVYAHTNVVDLVSHCSLENSFDLTLGELLKGINGAPGHPNSATKESKGPSGKVPDLDAGYRIPSRMRIHTCSVNDSLQEVFIKFAQAHVHRLLFVGKDGELEGLVSLSDLLSYFLD